MDKFSEEYDWEKIYNLVFIYFHFFFRNMSGQLVSTFLPITVEVALITGNEGEFLRD